MKRYIVYLPSQNDWIKAVHALQGLGKPQSDEDRLVTLASDASIHEVELKLTQARIRYIASQLHGQLCYMVGSGSLPAVEAIR